MAFQTASSVLHKFDMIAITPIWSSTSHFGGGRRLSVTRVIEHKRNCVCVFEWIEEDWLVTCASRLILQYSNFIGVTGAFVFYLRKMPISGEVGYCK